MSLQPRVGRFRRTLSFLHPSIAWIRADLQCGRETFLILFDWNFVQFQITHRSTQSCGAHVTRLDRENADTVEKQILILDSATPTTFLSDSYAGHTDL